MISVRSVVDISVMTHPHRGGKSRPGPSPLLRRSPWSRSSSTRAMVEFDREVQQAERFEGVPQVGDEKDQPLQQARVPVEAHHGQREHRRRGHGRRITPAQPTGVTPAPPRNRHHPEREGEAHGGGRDRVQDVLGRIERHVGLPRLRGERGCRDHQDAESGVQPDGQPSPQLPRRAGQRQHFPTRGRESRHGPARPQRPLGPPTRWWCAPPTSMTPTSAPERPRAPSQRRPGRQSPRRRPTARGGDHQARPVSSAARAWPSS
jgi:hypothetical protein